MTETKEIILEKLFPGYEEAKSILKRCSDYELNLIINNCPKYIEDLEDSITKEVQWSIVGTLFGQLINNFYDFFSNHESLIRDYFYSTTFITYGCNNAWWINKEDIIDICIDLLEETHGEYSIKNNIDFRDIVLALNQYHPIKFCIG